MWKLVVALSITPQLLPRTLQLNLALFEGRVPVLFIFKSLAPKALA